MQCAFRPQLNKKRQILFGDKKDNVSLPKDRLNPWHLSTTPAFTKALIGALKFPLPFVKRISTVRAY